MGNINLNNSFLTTHRLIIRPINDSDLSDMYEYAKVNGVGEACGWHHHKSKDETKKIIDMMMGKNNVFSIILKSNKKMIGTIGFEDSKIELEGNGFELGYCLSKDYWGKGIMTEAIREVIRFSFLDIKLDYLTCGHYLNNNRSERVIVKNNFNYVKDINFKNADNIDTLSKYYQITRDEYLSKKELVQLFDEEGNPLDIISYRGEKPMPNIYLGVVDVVIKNIKYNKYLVTRRDINKETWPGFWELVSGGAIDFKEDKNQAALREAYEETGIKVNNLLYLYSSVLGSIKFFIYFAETDCELDDVKLQKGETIDYKWLKAKEFIRLSSSKKIPESQRIRLKRLIDTYVK